VEARLSAGTVLVTGATGFVGRALCRRLVASGYVVRGLSRRPAPGGSTDVDWWRWPDAGLSGDVLLEALTGCRGVIHLAARVHVTREAAADPLAQFREANVELTRRLVAASRRAGVGRFVLASSVKAVGERFGQPITESQVPAPEDAYGRSKLEAEAVVADAAADGALWAPVLRFPLVYGPGVRANMRALFSLVARGVPLPFGAVRNRRSYLYVENAASALVTVLEHEGRGAPPFFVSDGVDFSTPDLVRSIAAALGRRARLVHVPVALLRGAARVGDAVAGLLSAPRPSAMLSRLVDSLAVDAGHLRRTVGWIPPVTAEAGLQATATWYLREVEVGR
jgi:nucleoside-diphosphate-sugar epimerase